MENFERKISFAEKDEQRNQEGHPGESKDISRADREAEEAAMFDKMFRIDKERDIADIREIMKRIRKDSKTGRLASVYEYERDKKDGDLKYSDEQIENGQWEEDDLSFVVNELRKDRIDDYFENIEGKYEQRGPIADSVVRLDQEKKIAEDLNNGKPVLIRGNWRVGKTSMVYSLENHQFGKENSLSFDAAAGEGTRKEDSMDDFKKHFGISKVAQFIAERELSGTEGQNSFEKERQIEESIEKSQKPPFEFLNEYLSEKNEKVFLSLDEVVGLSDQPEKLEYLANLKNLSQVKIAVVLHRIASSEESFKKIFNGYETHFIRPLTVEEVARVIRKPLEGTSVTFTDDAVQKVFEFTGGRPMEVNNLCHALMGKFSEHKKYRITYRAEDIEELTKKDLWQLEKSFKSAAHTARKVYDHSMSAEERAITDNLIEKGEVPVIEIEPGTIQPLLDTGFAVKDTAKGVYRINGEFFKQVLEK